MNDGQWKSGDLNLTEQYGPMCKGCGHRRGHRRETTIDDRTFPGCPGADYDPADVAMHEAAQAP